MNTLHQPDHEFVGNLEHELRSTIRRQEQFRNGRSARTIAVRQLRWTTSVIALAAMCLGSAATYAVTSRFRAQTAELIIARAEAQLEFANARRELFLEEFHETEARAAEGLIEPEQLDQMQLELTHVETEAAARALDVEEARITGRDPDNSLSAPLLRGHDFVTERLELQRVVLVARADVVDRLAAKYASDPHQMAAIAHEQDAIREMLASLDARLALRQEYLAGKRTAREVELAQMQSSVEPQRRIAARHDLEPGYLLFVGTLEPRKNLPGLLQAYRLLLDAQATAAPLVLVGGKGWLYDEVFERVEALRLNGHVRFLHDVPDTDLPGLYNAASVLATPSFYEGFGLPALEAMACGTPVVVADRASLPEVVGEAGLLVNPDDVDDIARALNRVLTDEPLRARMRALGLAQAARFTWERTAQATLAVYREVTSR